jgi:hypothetical protein
VSALLFVSDCGPTETYSSICIGVKGASLALQTAADDLRLGPPACTVDQIQLHIWMQDTRVFPISSSHTHNKSLLERILADLLKKEVANSRCTRRSFLERPCGTATGWCGASRLWWQHLCGPGSSKPTPV